MMIAEERKTDKNHQPMFMSYLPLKRRPLMLTIFDGCLRKMHIMNWFSHTVVLPRVLSVSRCTAPTIIQEMRWRPMYHV